jgi:hypothetical protein
MKLLGAKKRPTICDFNAPPANDELLSRLHNSIFFDADSFPDFLLAFLSLFRIINVAVCLTKSLPWLLLTFFRHGLSLFPNTSIPFAHVLWMPRSFSNPYFLPGRPQDLTFVHSWSFITFGNISKDLLRFACPGSHPIAQSCSIETENHAQRLIHDLDIVDSSECTNPWRQICV